MQPSLAQERLVLVGAGSLATSLALALQGNPTAGELVQIYSPGGKSARMLAERLGGTVEVATTLQEIRLDATGYLLAVPDSALEEVVTVLGSRTEGFLVHCSGATPLEVLASRHRFSGVLYPLSTFSRERVVPMADVPLYLEVADEALAERLEGLARALSPQYTWATSEQRLALHLGAVIACNFSNHLIATAEELLQRYDLPPKALLPLLEEMLAKLHVLPAEVAQTGPARRGDEVTLQRHRALLGEDDELRGLYDLFSRRIRERS